MNSGRQSVFAVRSPWTATFEKLVSLVESDLLIASPFITRSAASRVISRLEQRGNRDLLSVRLITDLRPDSVLAGGMDLDVLTELGKRLPGFKLMHLPGVHAKVYVADRKMAVVSSGNLTESGLNRNVEYGVALLGEEIVGEIRSDFEGYASLGAQISVSEVASLSAEMDELRTLFQNAQRSVRVRARRAFDEKLKSARLNVLRQRAKGQSTHAIFAATLKFLLRNGPLSTAELQPLVQLLHPDLCDDSVERIIDGVYFGKKWKHHVRGAQVSLRRHGEIRFDGARWHLVGAS